MSSADAICSPPPALSQEDIVNLALLLDLNSPSLGAKKPFSSCSKSSSDDSEKSFLRDDLRDLVLPFYLGTNSKSSYSGTKKSLHFSPESRLDDSGRSYLSHSFLDSAKYYVPCSTVDPERLPTYIPVGVDYHPGMDKSLLSTPGPNSLIYIGPLVLCSRCSKEHSPFSDCTYFTCKICLKVHYQTTDCSYRREIPQSIKFFETICSRVSGTWFHMKVSRLRAHQQNESRSRRHS